MIIAVAVSFNLASLTAFGATGEPARTLAARVRNEQASRVSKVAQMEAWLKSNPDSPDAVILEHLIAELYRGEHCNEPMDMKAWRNQLERTVTRHANRQATNIFLLEMMVTYAQLIADSDPGRSAQLFKQVVESPPDDIEVPPEYVWASLGREVAVNRLKQGVIWAILNDRTRSVTTERDDAKRNAALEQAYSELSKELSATKEGQRCLSLSPCAGQVPMRNKVESSPWVTSRLLRREPGGRPEQQPHSRRWNAHRLSDDLSAQMRAS